MLGMSGIRMPEYLTLIANKRHRRLEYGFLLRKLNRVLDVGKRGSKDSRMTFDPMIDSTQA